LNARGFGMGNNHRHHRSPTGKYQAGIVEVSQRGDRPVSQVAKDLDLTEAGVQAWAGRAGRDAGTGNDRGLTGADRRELAELRRENRRLREDVEILKRAAAIFATATR
jgi:transposase